jgi:hypothetical protein
MITKEKVKKEIDRLSDVELEKVYLYLSSLKKGKKKKNQYSFFKTQWKIRYKESPFCRL